MKVVDLSQTNSIANNFMAEIRDAGVQTDRLRFRKNMARLGEVLAYEMSKELTYTSQTINTPLSPMEVQVLAEQPVLISILRAGMPFFEGIQSFFDKADAGFVGAFRSQDFQSSQVVELNYFAVPDLTGKTLVIADPMLATGRSIVDTISHLQRYGQPSRIFLLAVIAAPEGIALIGEKITTPVALWCGAVDEKLNDKAYIVPGLGDAGDLAYGPKL